jgi:hypothetical protein
LRILENKVLRTVFISEREEERGWRKLYNEKLYNFSPPNFIRMMKEKADELGMQHARER